MEQQGRPVSRDEFEGRKIVEDERFRRDKERLDEYQKAIADLTKISGTLSQIVERHDKDLSKHDERLDAIERHPADTWSKVKMAVMTSVVTGIMAFLLGLFLNTAK